MTDIRRRNYQVFLTQEQENAARYIDNLASSSGHDVSKWDIFETFKDQGVGGFTLLTEKNKINEVFFKQVELRKTQVPPIKMGRAERDQLANAFHEIIHIDCKKMGENLINYEREAVLLYANYENYMHKIQDINHKLSLPPPSADSKLSQIDQILMDDFWELTDNIGTDFIQFKTAPIILRYVNKAQAADMTVPLGRFYVRLGTKSCSPTALPMNNPDHPNVSKNKHNHPHVCSTGKFCFGNMLTDFNKAVGACDYVKVMEFAKTVLTGYWPDNPYVPLDKFRDEFEARVKNEQAQEKMRKELEDKNSAAAKLARVAKARYPEATPEGQAAAARGEEIQAQPPYVWGGAGGGPTIGEGLGIRISENWDNPAQAPPPHDPNLLQTDANREIPF